MGVCGQHPHRNALPPVPDLGDGVEGLARLEKERSIELPEGRFARMDAIGNHDEQRIPKGGEVRDDGVVGRHVTGCGSDRDGRRGL